MENRQFFSSFNKFSQILTRRCLVRQWSISLNAFFVPATQAGTAVAKIMAWGDVRQGRLSLQQKGMTMPSESTQPQAPLKGGPAAARSFGRAANWTVGVAAAALVLISVGGYFYHREQLSAIAADHLRLIVTGPSCLQAGVAAEYMSAPRPSAASRWPPRSRWPSWGPTANA